MTEILADLAEIDEQDIDGSTSLAALDMDSLMQAEFETILAQDYGREIASDLAAAVQRAPDMTVGELIAWFDARLGESAEGGAS
ncbi:acyl carrier protein [Streptomyces sp. NPDC053048]|uniref:acyl carrier protein n=1 Tax=Streptomyces sp. NPDC053048 TaxID=3365694 RepID=UPI0037D4B50F